jgi:hypothetical protein
MRKTDLVLIIIFLFALSENAEAQSPILAYYENASGGLKIHYASGKEIGAGELNFGDEIPVGSTVITEKGDFVEIELKNGSIIRINENTNFTITSIRGINGANENIFEVYIGKFRAVAAKTTGADRYIFKSRTAICGVRGTDTGMEAVYDQSIEGGIGTRIFVFNGLVEVTKIEAISQKALNTITLKGGQWANTSAPQFGPVAMTSTQQNDFLRGLKFKKLDPVKVAGYSGGIPGTETTLPPGEGGAPPPGEEPAWIKALREALGMEIGTLTIGDLTYGKIVLTPTIKIENLRLVLFLPVIYQSNMFDPDDWYKPNGNNEWSFGFDAQYEDDMAGRIGDIFADLILKIKSLEYGERGDDFFIRLGNLAHLTLGHGLIMRNYANDTDFPAVRRLGFNMGLDFDTAGFELVSNDLALACRGTPEVAGARIYLRPAGKSFPLAFGFSIVVDFHPADALEGFSSPIDNGDPLFINLGLDSEFLLSQSDSFGLTLFADLAFLLPYFREEVAGSINTGFAFDALWYGPDDDKVLSNYGLAMGLLGKVSEFDWRLEARYYTGIFKPAFFTTLYDRLKGLYVYELIDYLLYPEDPENRAVTCGLYGEGTYTWDKVLSFTAGYLLPVVFVDDGVEIGDDDYLLLQFTLEQGIIPVLGIYFQISYERTKFITTLLKGQKENLNLFDEHTILKTAIGYPLTENVHLVFYLTTALKRDAINGEIVYNADGRPVVVTVLSFETQIRF